MHQARSTVQVRHGRAVAAAGVGDEKDRRRGRAVGKLDGRPDQLRVERIGLRRGGFGIWIRIRKFQREHVGDQLLHIGRQRGRRLADDAIADVDLLSGKIDHRDRLQRGLVEQDVRSGGAVGLDQHLELGIGRCALARNREVDLDQHRGAADAHGRDRRVDLHVAVLGGLAGDEGDGPGHQAEQRGVVRPVGVVDHLVEHHPRIRRQAEHGAVDEGDAERRVRAGLHDIALFDVVAVVQDDRDAVADRGRAALKLADVADHLMVVCRAAGLAILHLAGQRVDEVAGQVGAVGGSERGVLLALEIVVQDEFAVVLGKDQVDAGSREIAVEQKLRVGNQDRIRGGVRGQMIDVDIGGRMRARAVRRNRGVKFANVIQRGTAKWLITI